MVKSLEAALWALHNADNFREAVLKAVNLGDDADTTGAVCGQLAGAYWGVAEIHPDWLDRLAHRKPRARGMPPALGSAFHACLRAARMGPWF